jgi:hypothetical protein
MTVSSRLRENRLPALVVGALTTALALVACGSPNQPQSAESASSSAEQQPSFSAPATPTTPPNVNTAGRVNSISESTIALTSKKGPTSVVVGPSTRVYNVTPAQLTDVQNGICVAVSRTVASTDNGTPPPPAKVVTLSAPAPSTGKCNEGVNETGISGSVNSINGTTISVDPGGESTEEVTVDPRTRYQRQEPVSQLFITAGACVSAAGPLGPNGALEAARVTVVQPVKGLCPGA